MTEPYKSAPAVEAAIRDAARNAFAADRSMSTQDRIRQEYFRRFLSRIFSERDDSDWLLKGGTGVLARVASGRRTTDIDLFRANNTLDGALAELIRLASMSAMTRSSRRASVWGSRRWGSTWCVSPW